MTEHRLDGERFLRAVAAGCFHVIRHQQELDDINVFPVPDGDTGTNLALTLRQVAETALREKGGGVGQLSRSLANAALIGSRGNSGAIMAQFFEGLAEGLEGCDTVDLPRLADAAVAACRSSFEAVAEPREGTILSVVRAWAEALSSGDESEPSLMGALARARDAARDALERTPRQLEVLARAGVVDAGGLGFVRWIEGMLNDLEGARPDRVERAVPRKPLRPRDVEPVAVASPYRFCTECHLEGIDLDLRALRRALGPHGDSLVVAGSTELARVHLHTDAPDAVFSLVSASGRIVSRKVEDMRAQELRFGSEAPPHPIAVVTDSACDLPEEFLKIHRVHVVPVQVIIGERAYRDKLEITPQTLYGLMRRHHVAPKTSQPAPGEFKQVFETALRTHESVVYIGISGALSGTLQAARSAASMVDARRIRLIDSRNVSGGIGLLVQEAIRKIREGTDLDAVVETIERAVERVKIFVSVPTIEYMVRGGRVKPIQGLVAKLLNLKPVLSLDPRGAAFPVARVFGTRASRRRVLRLVEQVADSGGRPRFAVAHADAIDAAGWFYREIASRFGAASVTVVDAAPALGVHAGPGVAAVAVLTL